MRLASEVVTEGDGRVTGDINADRSIDVEHFQGLARITAGDLKMDSGFQFAFAERAAEAPRNSLTGTAVNPSPSGFAPTSSNSALAWRCQGRRSSVPNKSRIRRGASSIVVSALEKDHCSMAPWK